MTIPFFGEDLLTKIIRKRNDPRYALAIETGWAILTKHYEFADHEVDELTTHKYYGTKFHQYPDLFAERGDYRAGSANRVGVAIGVLREESLRKYLLHCDELVHLPLSADDTGDPTHFRVFVRNRARLFTDGKFDIAGDGLIHGRSLRRKPK